MKKFSDYCGIPVKAQVIKTLTEKEKYLFGVISYNATEQGSWIITNKFLTSLFNTSAGVIAKRIYSLEREGLLTSAYKEENGSGLYEFKILFPLPV